MASVADLLNIASTILVLFGGAIVGSYWLLAIASMLTREPRNGSDGDCCNSFCIVIPAHNEESDLGTTLRSCQALRYPTQRVAVYVVADNCSDDTARVAREHTVHCLERNDKTKVGKGYALEFAFEHIDLDAHDAVAVLDADCVIDADALCALNRALLQGHKVLQACCIASNPDESAISYSLAVGNTMENHFFYAPKSRLGMASLLHGTGMVLHRDILRRCPWNAHSVAEDVEYSLVLAKHGISVRFVEDAGLRSQCPTDRMRLQAQRTRWAGGSLGFAKRQAARLMWEGFRKREWTLVDVGWTLLLLSRPLVILLLLLAIGLSGTSTAMKPGPYPSIVLGSSVALLILLGVYFSLGIVRLGLTRRRIVLLLMAPFVALELLTIAIGGLLGVGGRVWRRTPRCAAGKRA